MPYQQMGSVWWDPSSGSISPTNPDAGSSGQMPSLGQIVSAPAQQMQNYAQPQQQQTGWGSVTSAALANAPTGLNYTPGGALDPRILDYYRNNPAFTGTMQLGKPIQAGGYQISPSFSAMTGSAEAGTQAGGEFNGVSAWDGTSPKYHQYDASGKYLGDYDVSHHSMMEKIAPFIPALFAGGAMALGGGLGAGGVGSAGGFVGEGAASGIPAWDAALSGAGTGAGAAGAAAGGLASSASSGFNLPDLSNLGKIGSGLGSLGSAVGSLLNGGGSSGGSGGSGGGLGNNGLLSLLGGGIDAYNQNKAGDTMKSWLDSQQAKIDGLYSPNSPEYNQLWEEMSRKDAAAGRNSQYGPRSVDFAAKIATAKADETQRFTTGVSKAYSDALNQQASSPTGLLAALQRNGLLNSASQGASGLGGILQSLSNGTPNNLGGGITMNPDGSISAKGSSPTDLGGPAYSNDDIWNMINGGGYGSPTPNLTPADLNDWWMN